MATRTFVQLRSGNRVAMEPNDERTIEHLVNAIIRESLDTARAQRAATIRDAMPIIKAEVAHVKTLMDDESARRYGIDNLGTMIVERMNRDLETIEPPIRQEIRRVILMQGYGTSGPPPADGAIEPLGNRRDHRHTLPERASHDATTPSGQSHHCHGDPARARAEAG